MRGIEAQRGKMKPPIMVSGRSRALGQIQQSRLSTLYFTISLCSSLPPSPRNSLSTYLVPG